MRQAFVGIDVAFAKGKRLPIVVCTRVGNRLVPLRLRSPDLPMPPIGRGNAAVLDARVVTAFAEETAEYLNAVCARFGVSTACIAIDAPSAPRREGESHRAAEKALWKDKVSAFSTPSRKEFETIQIAARKHLDAGRPQANLPYANKLWMLVGFALFERLESIAPCIEVFPNAIVSFLGCELHKSEPGGVEEQLRAAALHTGWPDRDLQSVDFRDIGWCPAHDRLDAYLSAWVASLSPLQSTELPRAGARWAYGDPDASDAIWVPILTKPSAFPDATHAMYAARSLGSDGVGLDRAVAAALPAVGSPQPKKRPMGAGPLSRVCPACSDKLFVRWPWGWDAHAAYKCPALSAQGSEARKQEFREHYGHLFRVVAQHGDKTEDREDELAFEEHALEPDLPFESVVADLTARKKL